MKKKRKSFSVLEKMTSVSCFPVGRTCHNFGLVLQLTSTMVKKNLIVLSIYLENCLDLHICFDTATITEQYKASKVLLHICMCLRFSVYTTELCSVRAAQYASYCIFCSWPWSEYLSQSYHITPSPTFVWILSILLLFYKWM